MSSSSSQAQSRAAYLESKKKKEKLALDQQKMTHEKKGTVSPMVVKPIQNQFAPSTHSKSVSPVLISQIGSVSASIIHAKEANFVSLPIKSGLIQSETPNEKVISLFEEALSTSFGSTSVRPRSVAFPNFEEWK
jgi:hypothetical protein